MMDWISFLLGFAAGALTLLWISRHKRAEKRTHLDQVPPPPPVLPHDLKQQVLKLRAEGRLIEAVKLVRDRMVCGLKEAKDVVDNLR
jgi:ribosomal protein L7/L12